MSLASLAEAIKKELTTLGIPAVLEMALVSTTGKVLYSDLSKNAMSKISPFYESLLIMGQGDNLSLAADSTKTIVASRITARTILIALTDKKVGIVLTKMGSVADKFGRLLDELTTMEESNGRAKPILADRAVSPEISGPRAPTPVVQGVQPSQQPSKRIIPEAHVRPVAAPLRKSVERVIIPSLTDVKILEKCSEKDRRFLERIRWSAQLERYCKEARGSFL